MKVVKIVEKNVVEGMTCVVKDVLVRLQRAGARTHCQHQAPRQAP